LGASADGKTVAQTPAMMPGSNGGWLRRGGPNGGAGGRPRSEVVALIRDTSVEVAVPRLAHLAQKAKDQRVQLEAALALTKLAIERSEKQVQQTAQQTQVNIGTGIRVIEPGEPVPDDAIHV
jgi:hypothetical protein